MRNIITLAVIAVLAIQSSSAGAGPRRIQVKVVDESGEPVSEATVSARYLATVSQNDKNYNVPLELATFQTTDLNGCCELRLKDVDWSLAGLEAVRPGLTSDEARDLLDNGPKDHKKLEAYEHEVYGRAKQFRIGFILLDPSAEDGSQLTLKLTSAERITGKVRLDGKPLVKAYVHFFSRPSPIDKLFPVTAPQRTDADGRIDYFSVPGELDRGRVVIESEQSKRVLSLTNIDWTRTTSGRELVLATNSKDYELITAPEKN